MTDFLTLDPVVLIPLLAGLTGMAVGLVTIWNSVKSSQQKQRADSQAADIASENRLKEYFDLRVRIVETEIEGLKRDLKTMDDTYTRKLEDRSAFFSAWVERIEEKMEDKNKNDKSYLKIKLPCDKFTLNIKLVTFYISNIVSQSISLI